MTTLADEVEDFLAHFTPTAEQRREFAAKGWAMPDGSYFVRPLPEGRGDLQNVISAVGRATPNAGESDVARRNAVRRHGIKRARELDLMDMIPDTWNSDGSLKQSAPLDEFLEHFGVKGMHWGVRRERSQSRAVGTAGHPGRHLGQQKHPVSEDAARADELRKKIRKQGVKSLSNQDLNDLINRMNLENQYGNLTKKNVNEGQKYVEEILKNSGKQTAQTVISKYATAGVEHLIKKARHK